MADQNIGMLIVSLESIEAALPRVSRGLEQYLWLQQNVHECDVSSDSEFQRRFDAFYRVRRAVEWRTPFFRLMEDCKANPITFSEALAAIKVATGRVEASFASKLVATLDPCKPVIDRFVISNFGLRLPIWGTPSREERIVEMYDSLCSKYNALLRDSIGTLMIEMFDQQYPNRMVSRLKKIDLILWQMRS
jgi:hypothetical protein